jgi:predicted enzyme related to lactoylglutathione lyase
MPSRATPRLRLAGIELYFDDLERAREFYRGTLGLEVKEERAGHFVQFDGGRGFVCLERKGAENYPSQDKAVVFFAVENLAAMLESIGEERIVKSEASGGEGRSPWAVLHDPEGHNVLLLESRRRVGTRKHRRRRK